MKALGAPRGDPFAEALEELRAEAPPKAVERIDDETVRWAARVIDESPILARIAEWEKEDRRGPGGAPRKFPVRSVLIALVLAVRLGKPLLATTLRDLLYFSTSAPMREFLEMDDPPPQDDPKAMLAAYRNVRSRLHGILKLVDPSILPKNRRLSAEEFDAIVLARSQEIPEATLALRYTRLHWLINAIIEASIRQLPRRIRRRWKGSVGIDATPIPAGVRPERRKKRRGGKQVEIHSADPDAGWYIRDPDQRDTDTPWLAAANTPKDRRWCHEATLVVMVPEAEGDHLYPYLVVSMAPLTAPGREIGENAIRALTSAVERGHPASFIAGDRAYPNSQPEKYQLPALALGYRHVFDYRIDQLGHQGSYAGAALVDGHYYCPSMPEALVTATADYRKGLITKDVWQARIAARGAYRFRPKAAPDAEGHVRMLCPASDGAPTARCDLKPRSLNPKTAGRTRIPLVEDVRDAPPACCRQQSITVPPAAGAKFRQAIPHNSPEWQATYAPARSTNEGFHGIAKDEAFEALGSAKRRRIHGCAAQSLFVALLLFGANVRMIESFIDLAVISPDGSVHRPKLRRRKTDPIETWAPEGRSPPSATRTHAANSTR